MPYLGVGTRLFLDCLHQNLKYSFKNKLLQMKLKAGRRVYIPSQKTFGTVVREGGILGLSASYAVVDDLGKKSVFIGDNIEIVYVDSSEKVNGEKVERIPPDVVPHFQKNYTPQEAKKMTADLYDLCPEKRGESCEKILKSLTKKAPKKTKKTRKKSEI